MNFQLGLIVVLITIFMVSCIPPVQPQISSARVLGVLEVNLDSGGMSDAKFEQDNARAVTFREIDAVFGAGTTNMISNVNDPFDYLVATFPVSHAAGSSSTFQNLTLYALVKAGNVGGTAIQTITSFGGVTDTIEQTRLAKLLIPVHALKDDGTGQIVMDNTRADFQAFTSAEVSTATTVAGSSITVLDTILNYGFGARCSTNCTANSRSIPINGTGSVTIAIRVPKAAAGTAYRFAMNFVVLDESVSRVTRGMFPPESVAQAETRGSGVGATILMQFGLNIEPTSLINNHIDDINTSKVGASIQALGIGRISAGNGHSCGLTSIGQAYCWGFNGSGQLGNGDHVRQLTPVAVVAPNGGSVLRFSSIATYSNHSCGLTSSGQAYCWGSNGPGLLGNGDSTFADQSTPVAVVAPNGGNVLKFSSITVGQSHSCGLTSSGQAYCWGDNSAGQLGNGDTTRAFQLVPVAVVAPSGASPLRFSSISAGAIHTCGLTSAGFAYCWGYNAFGELGNGDTTAATQVVPVMVAPSRGSVLRFSSISAGGIHSCGLTLNGTAYCWGDNGFGELGNGDVTRVNQYAPVEVVAATGGSVLSFSSISGGFYHTCALTLSGTAYCWGSNVSGVLGNGGTASATEFAPVAVGTPNGGSTLRFSSISTSKSHSCGLTSNGQEYCWGSNANGELGNGDNSGASQFAPGVVDNTKYKL
jgi:alpha-tubulin suppressor-like RCC1 family protein